MIRGIEKQKIIDDNMNNIEKKIVQEIIEQFNYDDQKLAEEIYRLRERIVYGKEQLEQEIEYRYKQLGEINRNIGKI